MVRKARLWTLPFALIQHLLNDARAKFWNFQRPDNSKIKNWFGCTTYQKLQNFRIYIYHNANVNARTLDPALPSGSIFTTCINIDHCHQQSPLPWIAWIYWRYCLTKPYPISKSNNQRTCQATTAKYLIQNKINHTIKKSLQAHANSEGDKPEVANTIFCWATIANAKNKTSYLDVDRKFPYCSNEGKKYKFVAYD